MSTESVRKNLSDKLLKLFISEETEETRKELESRPQVVFISDLTWLDMTIL